MTVVALELSLAKTALSIDEDLPDNLLADLNNSISAAREFANRQAPDAPQSVANEAMLRFVGYLYEGPAPHAIEAVQNAGIWRKCGAEGLLNPWTVRRAGIVETPDDAA